MEEPDNSSHQIFSYHLVKMSPWRIFWHRLRPLHRRGIPGLHHSECFFVMNLGEGILSLKRFRFGTLGFLCLWQNGTDLTVFLEKTSEGQLFKKGWFVRLRQYRRWGKISEIEKSEVFHQEPEADQTVVALTLARLNLLQTFRFIKWGRPVESQVRDHGGQVLALAGFRPPRTFSTFSIWKNEAEMVNMVLGKRKGQDGEEHISAMKERSRKPFHHEFSTMRFLSLGEEGSYQGKSNYIEKYGVRDV